MYQPSSFQIIKEFFFLDFLLNQNTFIETLRNRLSMETGSYK